MSMAIKTFEVVEGSLPGGYYEITVLSGGKVVERFERDTMVAAQRACRAAGYQPVAWAEGDRIVLQSES